ncbi:uncharacterized protein LOC130732039 [Lotus japonicus]|uniref:uncharacterized protein LOC130732039 n=1 Tax=Lotus japonicus TaxID=34305 RepID=UPI0025855D4F|nr:uncharacterized protein LOC130732039 [Lotus japonicus]
MGEVYYMRILLTKQRGCDSFASLRTVKGVVYPTFQDACDAMGLMEDEREYVDGIIHMSEIGSGSYLRHLFVTLLSTNAIGKPREVWDKTWRFLADEFLNDLKCSGIPNHRIVLKVGVPIMLIQNIDQSAGLCNGTRLIVSALTPYIIVATALSGSKTGKPVYIPRLSLTPSDTGLPFKFSRRQFPITVCFAMTINKSQGQSLSHVGLYLPRPVFTHGQLYVALSRVKSRKRLKILIVDDKGVVSNCTRNVVYEEVFQNI